MGHNAPHARVSLNNSIQFRHLLKRVYAVGIVFWPMYAVTRWVKYENLLANSAPSQNLFRVRPDYATGNLTTTEASRLYKITL